ncbi:NAD(P) transhydrogenase subunit alpha [Muriicola jejuensis]|uniref:NAD(P) transhydrogenase subunit alpha part 1 n=1 Tax=Muriicola jejuensis TaxID=504488 RepID=A0A6P0U7M0_9FLAO|nr:NAD(P) transhydrogenase subunit alpha [Muriicola jejuensis]NER09084.1 NAD(P)(+) transhydrogenase (Re/Si-specific) subunit alpha [Muriicola jejuensis]SMP11362.1 NAD(P) transhydrogenase subunit alpha [Muriicola jejuensis]
MTIGILKEPNDKRVSLVPSTLKKFKVENVEFWIQEGAGSQASYLDAKYEKYGKVTDREDVLKNADILVTINPIPAEELSKVKKGALLVAVFSPFQNENLITRIKELGLQAASLDMIPRTTIAQTMDILSSMASIAGYRAVLLAATELPGFFPMMITAAGSIKPCKVLVLGAGVAGLQAVATARRLGAIVEAFDVRAAAKEEVESLGAKFVEVPGAIDKRDAGGYAVEQTPEFMARQQEEVQLRAASSDVVITTAQILGKKAPILLTKETVERMKPGSIVIDLAASSGGNCELSQDKKTIVHKGVKIIGNSHLPSDMPRDASYFFSNNAANYLKLIIKDGKLNLDLNNQIIEKTLVTRD